MTLSEDDRVLATKYEASGKASEHVQASQKFHALVDGIV